MPNVCTECGYEQTYKGCETPGCLSSIWMTDEVRERRQRDAAEAAERQRINEIRDRYMFRPSGCRETVSNLGKSKL